MKISLLETLLSWPKNFITGTDLKVVLSGTHDSRHAIIKRACADNILLRLRNDLYLIKPSLKKGLVDTFELAQLIWGPSYISFESALSHYDWIPEAVYTTTSACCKKGKSVTTPIGNFSYEHVPIESFSLGLHGHHTNNVSYFIAQPWKAVADLIYARRKSWKSLMEFSSDLRVEWETITTSDKTLLFYLSQTYPSRRTQHILTLFYKELNLD